MTKPLIIETEDNYFRKSSVTIVEDNYRQERTENRAEAMEIMETSVEHPFWKFLFPSIGKSLEPIGTSSFQKGLEPACLLIPRSDSHVGPCTSLICLPVIGGGFTRIVSGHLNGWIVMWILEKRRPAIQWIGHPDTHVTCLHFWPDEILISQGRDGYIRFWTIPPYEFGQEYRKPPPTQAMAELPTCDVTFCHMSFWPSVVPTDDLDSSIPYYLAHVSRGGEEEDNSTRENGCYFEVVELPKNVIVVHTEAGYVGSATIGSSSSGMCMALQGIPRHPNAKWNQSCLVLVANEAGQLLLFGDGVVLARLNDCLGKGIPIMAMSLQPIPALLAKDDKLKLLMAVGGPSGGSADEPSQVDLLFVQLVFDENDCGIPVLRPISNQIPCANVGVSSLSWRQDGRLVAVGQWDGRVRLVEHFSKQKSTVRCLGWLTSLGGLNEGELLGDWAATTVTKPHGPMIDQKSTTIRSCFFTPGSDWLLSAAPANAGATGSVLVWDVYRTCK